MRDIGLGEFCEPARSVNLDRLIAKFETLERDRDERKAEKTRLVDKQCAALSRLVAAPSHWAVEAPGGAA
jgi:hypothetical protein